MDSWDNIFIGMCDKLAEHIRCVGNVVACVLVHDNHPVSFGINGTPSGYPNCTDGGCARCTRRIDGLIQSGEQLDECICIHAEVNAILNLMKKGGTNIPPEELVLYCTVQPCLQCLSILIQFGIRRIKYVRPYPTKGDYTNLTTSISMEQI